MIEISKRNRKANWFVQSESHIKHKLILSELNIGHV